MTNDTESQWPEMVAAEYDDHGVSVEGTTPTSVVSIGGYAAHNKPIAFIRSAGCAYCNRWAVDFYVGRSTVTDGDLMNAVERRTDMTLIYFCDEHREAATDELLEKYGSASNRLDLDLAEKVAERAEAAAKWDAK